MALQLERWLSQRNRDVCYVRGADLDADNVFIFHQYWTLVETYTTFSYLKITSFAGLNDVI